MSLVKRLKEANRLPIIVALAATTILCIGMVALRIHYTDRRTFTFLIWNIFLALIPYGVSTALVLYHRQIKNRWLLLFPFLIWLSFFPNAPYILTDLFHLKRRTEAPFWYDLALILFFAWNGLMLGYASLLDIQTVLSSRFSKWVGWVATIASLILAAFGIYLGRYLRWNSWDIISSPNQLYNDIVSRIVDPTSYPRTYGVTIVFSVFLLLGYITLIQFAKTHKNSLSKRL